MSQKQLDQLSQKLIDLLSDLSPTELAEALAQMVDEWEEAGLIPPESAALLRDQPSLLSADLLIEAASAPLTDRLNFNRNQELPRALKAQTPQAFSDALR